MEIYMSAKPVAVFLALLAAVSFADEAQLVKAKYSVAECYINATDALVSAVGTCAGRYDVGAPDLSSYLLLLESDRSALKSASTIPEFDSAWEVSKTHMNQSAEAVRQANSSLTGSNFSIGLAKLCYAGEMLKAYLNGTGCVLRESFTGVAKVAVLGFYDASIVRGDVLLNASRTGGLEAAKMEEALDYAKSLRPELVDSLDSADQAKFLGVRLRYGRSAIRFFTEYDTALADWAEPLVQAGNNYNKADILSTISTIKEELSEINSRCPADYSVADSASYESANAECWKTLKSVEGESRQVIALFRSGVPVVVAGQGSAHASGTGNVSVFGNVTSLNATGTEDIYVTDYKGDSVVSIDATGEKQPDGSTKYTGFTDAKISGSVLYVRVEGTVTVDVAGKGIVRAQGNGTFSAVPGFETEGTFTEVGA